MTKRMPFNIPYRTGDVVAYVGKDPIWQSILRPRKAIIINECLVSSTGDHEYSTNVGAWFSHNDFELRKAADIRSIKLLCKHLDEELCLEVEEEFDEVSTVLREFSI
jgi:hypothetical protein